MQCNHGRIAVQTVIMRTCSRRKSIVLGALLCAGLLVGSGCVPASYEGNAGSQEPVNDVQYLESYGEWFEMPPYGSVWQPFAVADWAPFYHGHWMWTNDGWAWVSYEPFGWLVYHYGFWDYHPDVGWFWIPGDVWSPARVEWYTVDDYCAWAPLPPPDVYWPAPWEPFDTNVWVVVDIDRFTDDNIGSHRITTPLPRTLATRGSVRGQPPDIRIVREREKRSLAPVTIRKEPVDIRTLPPATRLKSIAPRDSTFERMILPRSDRQKVEKYAPDVKRDVLVPKKIAPLPERKPIERKPPDQTPAEQKPPERKPPEQRVPERNAAADSTKTPRRR
jgi:hypothetical protein